MARSTQNTSKKTKTKPPLASSKKSQSKQAPATDELRRERDEALEQLAATSEILRVIANSSTDLQPVLDAIVESTARVCSVEDASVRLVDGDALRLMAHVGPIPTTSVAAFA